MDLKYLRKTFISAANIERVPQSNYLLSSVPVNYSNKKSEHSPFQYNSRDRIAVSNFQNFVFDLARTNSAAGGVGCKLRPPRTTGLTRELVRRTVESCLMRLYGFAGQLFLNQMTQDYKSDI